MYKPVWVKKNTTPKSWSSLTHVTALLFVNNFIIFFFSTNLAPFPFKISDKQIFFKILHLSYKHWNSVNFDIDFVIVVCRLFHHHRRLRNHRRRRQINNENTHFCYNVLWTCDPNHQLLISIVYGRAHTMNMYAVTITRGIQCHMGKLNAHHT